MTDLSLIYTSLVIFNFFVLSKIVSVLRSTNTPNTELVAIQRLLSPPHSMFELLNARAIPNERLVRAFSLSNTFVSADTEVHKFFVERARSLLRDTERIGLRGFQSHAIRAVQASLPTCAQSFDSFIQAVTLRTVLVGLLQVDADPSDLQSADIAVVSSHITHLWALSKKTDPIPPHLLDTLNTHLRRLIPDADAYPYPLDYVIPVWETLWRVVATMLAHSHDDKHARLALEDFHAHPTATQFREFTDSRPSVEALVTETMRLHPPSRHISRSVFVRGWLGFVFPLPIFGWGTLRVVEYADVGSVQRSGVWGYDADVFDPMRHHKDRLTWEQEATLLPFGYGPLRCVARKWAPLAAGIMASAVLNQVDGEHYWIVAGPCMGGREGWAGWSVVSA